MGPQNEAEFEVWIGSFDLSEDGYAKIYDSTEGGRKTGNFFFDFTAIAITGKPINVF